MKKIIASAAALTLLLTMTGCGNTVGQTNLSVSELPQAAESATVDVSAITPQRWGGFAYKILPELTAVANAWETYYYKDREDVTVTISQEKLRTACTPDCYCSYLCENIRREQPMMQSEVKKLNGLDVIAVTFDVSTLDQPDMMRTIYGILCNDEVLTVMADYPKMYEKKGIAAAESVLLNTEYVGDYRAPGENRLIENDYFSLDADPKWSEGEGAAEGELVLKYTCADDLAQYLSTISLKPSDTEFYDNAADAKTYAQKRYEEFSDGAFSTLFRSVDIVKETTLFGLQCYRITYRMDNPDFGESNNELYVFQKNGVIMEMSTKVYKLGDYEAVRAEFSALADSIIIK